MEEKMEKRGISFINLESKIPLTVAKKTGYMFRIKIYLIQNFRIFRTFR